jgi:chromosome partitioning protein
VIFAASNVKGGVGKSTLAVHFACWLKELGLDVALVDADVQQSSSRWMKEVDSQLLIARVEDPNKVRPTLKELSRLHHAVVVDGPAGLTELNYRILISTDVTLVPCGPSLMDLEASQLTIQAIKEAQEAREGKPGAVFVANKMQLHLRLSQDMLETAKDIGIPLATTPIRLRQAYPDARSQGTTVFKMGHKTKEAADDLRKLFTEVFKYGQQNAA